MNIPKLDLHPDSAEWSEQINSYEHSMHLLKEIFECRITGDEDTLTMLSHPDSKNKHGLSVFKDTGKMHFRTGNFDGVEKEDTLTTWDFISVAMERNPIKCAHEFKWIDASNYLDEAKEVKQDTYEIISSEDRKTFAESLPELKPLMGDLISEAEQVILYGDTETGKTVLCYQMMWAMAEGTDLDLGNGVILKNDCDPKVVLGFDFEMSDQQYLKRIGKRKTSKNLHFVRQQRGIAPPDDPNKVFDFIHDHVKKIGAEVVFIDNVKALSDELEKSTNAKKFMQVMFKLARFENITNIVVMHTRQRDESQPLKMDDVFGSSNLKSLTDGMVGMAKMNTSDGSQGTYIMHQKSRDDEKTYGQNNVICTYLEPDEYDFLKHNCLGTMHVNAALSGEEKAVRYARWGKTVLQYFLEGENKSAAAKVLGFSSYNTVNNHIKAFKKHHLDKWEEFKGYSRSQLKGELMGFNLEVEK